MQKRDPAVLRSLTAFSIRLDTEIVPANAAFERFAGGKEDLWNGLDKSVATGAKNADGFNPSRPLRLTADRNLLFCFESSGQWRWLGFFKY